MAISSALKNIVREVAHALAKYADEHGWHNDEYHIYYNVNNKWSQVNFIFVSDHFDDVPEFTNYASVTEHLQREFEDHPQIFTFFGFNPRGSRKVEQGGIYAIGPNFREYRKVHRA
jgi:hypothetical protein